MKSIILFVTFSAVVTYTACAQKVYIGCPAQVDTRPNAGFLNKQAVDLVIVDSRTIPANAKIECQGNDIKQVLVNFLRSEFPSCKITLLPDTLSASNANGIKITIGITAYQASLSKSEWTGSVNYQVTISDNRNKRPKKIAETISNDTTRPNIFGYKAAKKCLFTSFDKSNQDLLAFIEGSLKD
jgi:hypothetical protein